MDKNKDTIVIFLSEGGYKLSSWYGKILSKTPFVSLSAAKQACEDMEANYIIA